MTLAQPSKNSVRKAGSTFRRYARGEATGAERETAIEVIVAFRAQFTAPLLKVNNALRGFSNSLSVEAEVTQRLKKATTIRDKLTRESGLDLSRMQDIGGCRVVVEDVEDLRRMENRIRRTWGQHLHHEKDYIANPRESGYRAMHMVVLRDHCQIEIQLRTRTMHTWAEAVEAFSALTAENFKQDGVHVVQSFMKAISERDAQLEAGEPITPSQLDNLASLSQEVTSYLASLRSGV